MSGNETATVLGLKAPFHPGFKQIARVAKQRDCNSEAQPDDCAAAQQTDEQGFHQTRGESAADKTGPGLVRR